jgi:dihydrofolate reductase
MSSRLRVFIACSLDGFIAGPGDDLSWLPSPPEDSDEDYGWNGFIEGIGCLLMGRGTYDAVDAMEGVDWPHTERDTLIATHRPLENPPPRVFALSGDIESLVAQAKEQAAGRDVYIDGGNLIRQALDAGLVDEMILTLCPTILGAGHALFAGTERRHALVLKEMREMKVGLVQLTYVIDTEEQ